MNLNATLIAQLVVFFILAWFTMKFVWPPIVKALDERANKIADGLAAADKAKADLISHRLSPRPTTKIAHDYWSLMEFFKVPSQKTQYAIATLMMTA